MYPNFFKDISYRKYGVLVVRFVNIFNFNKRSAKNKIHWMQEKQGT